MEAEATLSGDGSVGDAAAGAANALADAARLDRHADGLAERARSLSAELSELARDVRGYREGLATDPDRLQETRERLSVLKGLQRKYGATETEVLSFLQEASSRMTALATADDRLTELGEEADRLQADLHERAGVVTRGRVDAGIGGEAGLAVGRRLAHLAENRQVLVVTHLPQIACFADRHILVEKGSGTAAVRVLSDDERIHELSRMLAGLTGSDGAVTHA